MSDAPPPGRPGIPPTWTSSAKTGVGTSARRHSRVWFTISHGILDEVYFPFIDQFPKEKKTLYQVRSQLAHGSDLLQADLEPWSFLLDVKRQEQSRLQENLSYIVRVAIYVWLLSVSIGR